MTRSAMLRRVKLIGDRNLVKQIQPLGLSEWRRIARKLQRTSIDMGFGHEE